MKQWVKSEIPTFPLLVLSAAWQWPPVGRFCATQFSKQPVFPLGEEKDYTIWLAHSTDPGDYGDGCILGYKEQFLRLRKSSVCQNGRDYVVTKQPSVCLCSLEDFLWYQHPSVPCHPLFHAGGSGTQSSYRSEQYFNPLSFPLPQEWRTVASHSGNCTEKGNQIC